jgi:glycosyltransferase involved in cell wall biosynthesis
MTSLPTKPLISVIMPAYNSAATIRESIMSVVDQSYKRWELIVVDDGSTDDTARVVTEIEDDRIRIYQKTNSGVADARNQGMAIAKGDFLAFLDADDLWLSPKLKCQLDCFAAGPDDLGLVHTGYLEFGTEGTRAPKPLRHCRKEWLSGAVHRRLMVHDFVATSTVMIRSEVPTHCGEFDRTLSGPEDWDFWIRIASRFTFGFIDKALVRYRQHPAGLSKNVPRYEISLMEVLNRHLLQSDLSPAEKALGLWLHYRHMSHAYARAGNSDLSADRLKKTIAARPLTPGNLLSCAYWLYHRLQRRTRVV